MYYGHHASEPKAYPPEGSRVLLLHRCSCC